MLKTIDNNSPVNGQKLSFLTIYIYTFSMCVFVNTTNTAVYMKGEVFLMEINFIE